MKFKPRSLETRNFIIETTAGLFNAKGYAGTSMSDITNATKLTKGSIYGNFENKDEVALAVFDYNLSLVTSRMTERIKAAKTNKEKLMVYVTIYSSPESNIIFKSGGCPLLNTGIEADDTNEQLRKRVEKGVLGWEKMIISIINDGMAAKEFRKGIDASQAALSIIALIQGGVFIAKATKNSNHLDTVMKTVQSFIEGFELK